MKRHEFLIASSAACLSIQAPSAALTLNSRRADLSARFAYPYRGFSYKRLYGRSFRVLFGGEPSALRALLACAEDGEVVFRSHKDTVDAGLLGMLHFTAWHHDGHFWRQLPRTSTGRDDEVRWRTIDGSSNIQLSRVAEA